MLNIDLRVNESVAIGETIVKLVQKSGQLARLQIQADPSIQVRRINSPSGINVAAQSGLGTPATA